MLTNIMAALEMETITYRNILNRNKTQNEGAITAEFHDKFIPHLKDLNINVLTSLFVFTS